MLITLCLEVTGSISVPNIIMLLRYQESLTMLECNHISCLLLRTIYICLLLRTLPKLVCN